MANGDDEYDYDFSDDENQVNVKSNNRDSHDDDEQHTQKLNSQVEILQEKLQTIELELEKEKKAHQETKHNSSKSSENLGGNEVDAEKVRQLEKEISKLRSSQPLAKVKDSLLSLAMSNDIDSAVLDSSDLKESDCLNIIKSISKLIETLKKKKKDTSMERQSSTANAGGDNELKQRIANLEDELRIALGASEDIRALKAKAIHLVERIRIEKEEKLKVESDLKQQYKKLEMLSDHIEKLMIHLKHEASMKIKTVDKLRESEKKTRMIKLKLDNVTLKCNAKDKLILELREGSKILEDQLRLMDEKYLELRTKLDYARDVASKKVRNAQKTASDLRVKYALLGNTVLLDNVQISDATLNETSYSSTVQIIESMHSSKSTGQLSSKKKKKKLNSSIPEHTIDQNTANVLDKIRRLRGGKQDWTDEKLRNLTKSR